MEQQVNESIEILADLAQRILDELTDLAAAIQDKSA